MKATDAKDWFQVEIRPPLRAEAEYRLLWREEAGCFPQQEWAAVIITTDIVASIQRAVGKVRDDVGEVYVSYRHSYSQRANEGYNALLGVGEPEGKFDEVPLDHLIGQDVPAAESGFLVLSCFPGGFAYIGPGGEFLGMERDLT